MNGLAGSEKLREIIPAQIGWDQRDIDVAFQHALVLQNLEHDFGHFLVLRDGVERGDFAQSFQ